MIHRLPLILLCLLTACAAPQASRIYVDKSDRKMVLLDAQHEVLREYRISLGFSPDGPKAREGDGRTPEGLYFISGRNPRSKYYKSLRISYPNQTDRALARTMGVRPGGDIMIHGIGHRGSWGSRDYRPRQGDWTEGCIAVTNPQIMEIWDMVPNGTPIYIAP